MGFSRRVALEHQVPFRVTRARKVDLHVESQRQGIAESDVVRAALDVFFELKPHARRKATRKAEAGPFTTIVLVRFTPLQQETITTAAKRLNCTISELLRLALRSYFNLPASTREHRAERTSA